MYVIHVTKYVKIKKDFQFILESVTGQAELLNSILVLIVQIPL